MSTILKLLLALAAAVTLIFLIVWLLRLRFRMVEQEQRLIIYRWGRFNRVAGPGPVLIAHLWDSVARVIDVHDHDRNFHIPNLFSFDVPFGYTLNLWYRYDPVAAAQNDKDLLLELAQYDGDRYPQIAVKLRDALVRAITIVQAETQEKREEDFAKQEKLAVTLQDPLASIQKIERNLSIDEKLMMIVPGLPSCERILNLVAEELVHSLPKIGVIFNHNHRITVVGLDISDDLASSFSRSRITALLHKTYPSLNEMELAHRVAMIEGLVDSYAFEGERAGRVQPELRQRGDNMEPRVRVRPEESLRSSARESRTENSAREAAHPKSAESTTPGGGKESAAPRPEVTAQEKPDWLLSQQDLEVLKVVPKVSRHNDQKRRSG